MVGWARNLLRYPSHFRHRQGASILLLLQSICESIGSGDRATGARNAPPPPSISFLSRIFNATPVTVTPPRDKRRCLRPTCLRSCSAAPPALQMGISHSSLVSQSSRALFRKMSYLLTSKFKPWIAKAMYLCSSFSKANWRVPSRDRELELPPRLRVRTCAAVSPD